MSLEHLKDAIRRAGEEAWYHGNMDLMDQVYAADYVSHRPPFPSIQGLEAVKQFVAAARQGYSDIQVDYEEMIAEGDTMAYRYTMRMKHTGVSPSLPIPPTGKDLTLQGCVVVHIREGQVVEEFEYSDYLGYLQQLGVVPPLG